jgi:hypothetical protein
MGTTPVNFDQYSGFTTTPSNFGGGGGAPPTSSSGNVFGVVWQGAPPYQLVVPVGYTTGQPISSTMTFTGQTLSSLGLTPGTYTYTWGSGANADSINVVVGGTPVTPTPTATSVTPTPTPTSGYTSPGWFFYAPEGPLLVGPPIANGNGIFTDNTGGGTDVTYNPNKSGGIDFFNFNVRDSIGVNYTTQFTNLQNNGGTISISQGSNTATYVLTSGMANVVTQGGGTFLTFNAVAANQTVNATSSFISGSTINVVVS